jgi:hypothetical protein
MQYKCPDCGTKKIKCVTREGRFEIHCGGKCACAADGCAKPLTRPEATKPVTYDELISELYVAPDIGVCEHVLGFLVSSQKGVLAGLDRLRQKGAVRTIEPNAPDPATPEAHLHWYVPGSLVAGKEMATRAESEHLPIDLTKAITTG